MGVAGLAQATQGSLLTWGNEVTSQRGGYLKKKTTQILTVT